LKPPSLLRPPVWALVLAGSVFGCSRSAAFVHQRLPDGTFSFKCKGELWVCLSHAQEVCAGGAYAVEGGWDQPITTGVDQNRVESHRSEAIVRCLNRGEDPRRRYDKPDPPELVERAAPTNAPSAPLPSASPAPAASPPRACVPGATQACVGAGACSGGQACLADGSAFGPCDCGSR
jgi:hypothetical protein